MLLIYFIAQISQVQLLICPLENFKGIPYYINFISHTPELIFTPYNYKHSLHIITISINKPCKPNIGQPLKRGRGSSVYQTNAIVIPIAYVWLFMLFRHY